MYYGTIKKYDVANGEGVRVSLFVSGCTNACEGCFQKQTWDFFYGKPYTKETEQEIIDALAKEYICGLTLLGGEPFEPQNQYTLVNLLRRVKKELPNKTIWSYTGFIYDQDLKPSGKCYTNVTDEILSYLDVLIDGPFIIKQKNFTLAFRGSENQRVIDMKKTITKQEVVLYIDDIKK